MGGGQEDGDGGTRELSLSMICCLACTQVFYHLGELDDALTYALGAGSLFDVNEDSEYVHTLVCELQHG